MHILPHNLKPTFQAYLSLIYWPYLRYQTLSNANDPSNDGPNGDLAKRSIQQMSTMSKSPIYPDGVRIVAFVENAKISDA